MLLTLVENMLKHGVWEDGGTGSLSILKEENTLSINTRNPVQQMKQNHGFQSGLNNIAERLKHTYGEHCSFIYGANQDAEVFEVTIALKMK